MIIYVRLALFIAITCLLASCNNTNDTSNTDDLVNRINRLVNDKNSAISVPFGKRTKPALKLSDLDLKETPTLVQETIDTAAIVNGSKVISWEMLLDSDIRYTIPPITKVILERAYYDIQLGDLTFKASIDVERKTVQFLDIDEQKPIPKILHIAYNEVTQLAESFDIRTSEGTKKGTAVEDATVYASFDFENGLAKSQYDKGDPESKKAALQLANRLRSLLVALMEKYHACQDSRPVFTLDVPALTSKINDDIRQLRASENIDAAQLFKKLDSEKTILFLFKNHGYWFMRSSIDPKGAGAIFIDEVIEDFAKNDYNPQPYKYCLPASMRKTVLVTLDRAKVTDIRY